MTTEENTSDTPPGWPAGVRPITFDEINSLGVDSENRLYWEGKRLTHDIRFTFLQKIAAFITVTSTTIMGIESFVNIIKEFK